MLNFSGSQLTIEAHERYGISGHWEIRLKTVFDTGLIGNQAVVIIKI